VVLRLARLVLILGGALMTIAGACATGVGIVAPAWLHSLLPPVQVDAPAVGGATVALGCATIGLGLVQLTIGLLLPRPARWLSAAAVTLSALLGAAWLSVAVVLATESATASSVWFLVGAGALVLVAIAYLAAALSIARVP
jgi:hypothetical protein